MRIAEMIDHTLLVPEADSSGITRLCDEAERHGFVAVCVAPVWVEHCVAALAGSGVRVATVIGFPHGNSLPEAKAYEAWLATERGADELDMVIPLARAKTGDWGYVGEEIAGVVTAASGRIVKVIIESATLTDDMIVDACLATRDAGAAFVKTSTGFHPAGGASESAVRLMRRTVGESLGVKASGGVRDCDTALRMVAAGASRIGTSSGVALASCLGRAGLPTGDLDAFREEHSLRCVTRR